MRRGDVSAIDEKGKYIDCVSMTNSAGWTGHALTPEEKGVETLRAWADAMRWT